MLIPNLLIQSILWIKFQTFFEGFFLSFFLNLLLHFRFWGTCEEHARLLHRYTHGSVICSLPFLHLYLAFLPMVSLPNSPPLLSLPYFSPTDPSVWCSPPCVHVFSLFNSHLWVRTCSVWFSVPVLVCWEWWFPSFVYVPAKDTNSSFFCGCIVFHGVCVPHFPFPVYHQWAFGLVPGLCYCKQCHNEHTCACVFIIEQFIILWVYTQ